jgi:hypothetical protein
VAKEPAFLTGVCIQSAKILTQLKEKLVFESAKIGFDKSLLGRACTLSPGTA